MPLRRSNIAVADAADLLRYMRERLDYDPERGAFFRKAGFRGVVIGSRLGTLDSGGKRQAVFLGKRYQVDHLVWLWETGALPVGRLSHVDRDNTNDAFANLQPSPEALPQRIDRESLRDSFLAKVRAQFGESLDLSDVTYVNTWTPVWIACPTHGAFKRKPEKLLASTHGCPKCCQEHSAAVLRARFGKTPEEKAARQLAYQRAHRELYRAAQARSREKIKSAHPERWEALQAAQRERSQAWRKTDKGRARGRLDRQRRRARLRSKDHRGVTQSEWDAICDRHTDQVGQVRCAYCKKPCVPTMDHVVPIARGGRHEASNVLPACGTCNSSKCDHLLSEWPRAKLLLSEDEMNALCDVTSQSIKSGATDELSHNVGGSSAV